VDTMIERIEDSGEPKVTSAAVDDTGRRDLAGKQTRRIYVGFGIGIVLAFAGTAVRVSNSEFGYIILFDQLFWSLIWLPALGLAIGYLPGRSRRLGSTILKRPQLRTRTLMVIIAYVAFLLGVGIYAKRLSDSALASFLKYSTSEQMVKVFRDHGRRSELVAELRRQNVEELRSGKIPSGLLTYQQELLRRLEVDPYVTAEVQRMRRDGIEADEERNGAREERNVVLYQELVEYEQRLADKYDHARRHPWLVVEPDPPQPLPR
jgi:hypothetical protein